MIVLQPNFFAKDGVVVLHVCLGTIQYWWISIGLVVVQLTTVFCPSVQYLSFFCEAFSWTISDSSSCPVFHSGQVFHKLVCPLTIVLPQIFFILTTLFSYPVFFCLFQAPLDVHFLVFLDLDLSKVELPHNLYTWGEIWNSLHPCFGKRWVLTWELERWT